MTQRLTFSSLVSSSGVIIVSTGWPSKNKVSYHIVTPSNTTCFCVYSSLVKARKIVWESHVIDWSSITQSEALWVWRCDVTTSNSIQDGGALVNILVFDLRVQLQHCTYQRKTLLFALIKVSTFICKRKISGLSSPLKNRWWRHIWHRDSMRREHH